MCKRSLGIAVAAVAMWAVVSWAATQTPATNTFRDLVVLDEAGSVASGSDRIRSDGLGAYQEGVDCVRSYVSGNMYFLRTVHHACAGVRRLVLDFSDALVRSPDGSGSDACHVDDDYGQAGELNICGSQAAADVRLIAQDLFRSNMESGTRVTLPISLQPDFRNTAFSLEFEGALHVGGNGTTRVATAGSDAVAELYKYVKSGRKTVKTSVGRFLMPFQATVTKLQ